MKHTIHRLLAAAVALEVVALVVAYSLRHTKEGTAETIGAVAWFTLYGNGLLVFVLAVAAFALALRRRRPLRAATH
jgi:hypothetical protein